jgi:hypothetical protein
MVIENCIDPPSERDATPLGYQRLASWPLDTHH